MYLGKSKQIQEILITILDLLAAEVKSFCIQQTGTKHFYTLRNGCLLEFKKYLGA